MLYRVQSLLCNRQINKGVIQPYSRQRISKHVPVATNTKTTMELLLEAVFYIPSVQCGYKEDNWGDAVSCCQLRVEFCTGGCEDKT
jgi:hypothetical protein